MSAVVEAGLTREQSEMVEANLGLVGFVLARYGRSFIKATYTEEDAWQEGFFGLCRAVQLFDPDHGNAFSTYAVQWIRQHIQRGAGVVAGRSYRSAMAQPGRSFADPVSLNQGHHSDESSVEALDYLLADDDVEAMALAGSEVPALLAIAARQCQTPMERDLFAWLADSNDGRTSGEVKAELAARYGCSTGLVAMRLSRFRQRCRVALERAS